MTEMILQNGAIPISSRNMVRFTANVPVEIALECMDGVRVEGRYGDRIKYTLTDARTMYADPAVAERIRELDLQPGELFYVCKRQMKIGNRKTLHWVVERAGDPETELERDLRRSLRAAQPQHPPPESAPSADIAPGGRSHEPEPPSPANGTINDRSEVNGSPDHHAERPQPPDTQLARALKTAIAAAADAEAFAKNLNYNVRFTTEDIRSMGITVLIGMQQRTPR